MAHGAPDYSNVKSEQAIYTLLDLGELAARLGSVDRFHRSGNLVWNDDFEAATLNWQSATFGAGAAVALVTTSRLLGAQSCELKGGAAAPCLAQISRVLPAPVVGKFSLEVALAFNSQCNNITLQVTYYTGARWAIYGIRYDVLNDRLLYYDPAGAWVLFYGSPRLFADVTAFHIFKLFIDLGGEVFDRLIIDDTTYDLLTLLPNTGAIGTRKNLSMLITNEGQVAQDGICYVDNVLVKQNEP
jgi:hypothetical protein